MSLRIKAVVEKFIKELKEALESDLQDRIMKEREMQSYIEEREREVAEREAAWKAELGRREVSVLPVASLSLSILFFAKSKIGFHRLLPLFNASNLLAGNCLSQI
jgi:uncharacterized protein with von Willebrand factor type A (vWA) domain